MMSEGRQEGRNTEGVCEQVTVTVLVMVPTCPKEGIRLHTIMNICTTFTVNASTVGECV